MSSIGAERPRRHDERTSWARVSFAVIAVQVMSSARALSSLRPTGASPLALQCRKPIPLALPKTTNGTRQSPSHARFPLKSRTVDAYELRAVRFAHHSVTSESPSSLEAPPEQRGRPVAAWRTHQPCRPSVRPSQRHQAHPASKRSCRP